MAQLEREFAAHLAGALVAVSKRAIPYFKTGKEMRVRLNRETVPSA